MMASDALKSRYGPVWPKVDTHGQSPWHLNFQALLDALRANTHSPTGIARGTLPFGLLDTGGHPQAPGKGSFQGRTPLHSPFAEDLFCYGAVLCLIAWLLPYLKMSAIINKDCSMPIALPAMNTMLCMDTLYTR